MIPNRIHLDADTREALEKAYERHLHDCHTQLAVYEAAYKDIPRELRDTREAAALANALLEVSHTSPALEALLDSLTALAAGESHPALIIEGLPEEDTLASYFSKSIAALMSSQWMDMSETTMFIAKNSKGLDKVPLAGPRLVDDVPLHKSSDDITTHSLQELHQDYSGVKRQSVPCITRLIRVRQQSNPPLTTALCTVDELLNYAVQKLYPQYAAQFPTRSAFKDHIAARLLAPIWHEGKGEPIPIILENTAYKEHFPHTQRYCFAKQSNNREALCPAQPNALDAAIVDAFYDAADMHKFLPVEALKPTDLLMFNNALVLHGAGTWQAEQKDTPKSQDRILENYFIDGSFPLEQHDKALREQHGLPPNPNANNPANGAAYSVISYHHAGKVWRRAHEESGKQTLDSDSIGR